MQESGLQSWDMLFSKEEIVPRHKQWGVRAHHYIASYMWRDEIWDIKQENLRSPGAASHGACLRSQNHLRWFPLILPQLPTGTLAFPCTVQDSVLVQLRTWHEQHFQATFLAKCSPARPLLRFGCRDKPSELLLRLRWAFPSPLCLPLCLYPRWPSAQKKENFRGIVKEWGEDRQGILGSGTNVR